MTFDAILTKEEFERFSDELIGENKECEKNLFSALYLFLKNFGAPTELDLKHILALLLATKVPRVMRNPSSDVDKLFDQVAIIDPNASCLIYYNAYKMYPEGMQNQAAGNLVYKVCRRLNDWPSIKDAKQVSAKDITNNEKQ
jgi:hypothetical protein